MLHYVARQVGKLPMATIGWSTLDFRTDNPDISMTTDAKIFFYLFKVLFSLTIWQHLTVRFR